MRWLLLLLVLITAPARADQVTVFAAASLQGPFDDIAEGFMRDTGHEVVVSYAGSATLARQVALGAPADMVLLASEDWMDHVEGEGALRDGTRRSLLSNRLVLIGSWHLSEPVALETLPDILDNGRLALALTEAVPAGIYARAALDHLGLWEAVQPRVVEADNVRAAQIFVAMGAARYGIVYATDVPHERRVTALAEIPEDSHPPIRYPVALTTRAGPAAEAFLAYLDTPLARATFTGAGFGLVAE